MARAKIAKNDNLVDPKLKKTFIEMADYWKGLDDRAKSAAGKRRQYEGEIKSAGYSMMQVKIRHLLQTPEGEAEFKAEMANRLLAAAYSDADIGDQLSLFLDGDRTPAVDRAYKEGQTCAMKNEAAVPKYDPNTDQYNAYMQGYHDEQERQVKGGIGKLDAKAAKANKVPKAGKPAKAKPVKAAAPAKPAGKRGRPPGPAKAKGDDAPPRRPTAQPVTRASQMAAAAAAPDDDDSYFSKSKH